MKKLMLVMMIALVVQGCSEKLDSAKMVNSKWLLSEWPERALPVNAQATLNFGAENKIGGKSFCNSYGGNGTIVNETVKFEQIFGTKMFCSEFNEAENNYIADLQTVNSLKMDGAKLQLLKDGQVVMVFVKGE